MAAATDGAAAETVTVATVGGAAVSCVGGGEVGGLCGSGLLRRRPRGRPPQSCVSACDQGTVSTSAPCAPRSSRRAHHARGGSRRTQTAASQATAARGPGRRQGCRALGEAPAPLAYCLVRRASASAARSLQLASNTSTHMPIVQHVHVHAEHDAMTKPLNTTCSKWVEKWLRLHTCSVLLRCKCVDASCSYPTAAKRSSWRTNGFAMLTYDAKRQCWNVGPGGNCAA